MNLPDPLPEVSLQAANYTVYHWTMVRRDDPFDFDAPYQRGSVWTDEQRRALVRSLLIGLPIGIIYVSELPYSLPDGTSRRGYVRIIDGKQRILTMRSFFNDEIGVPGHWFREEHLEDPSAREREVFASDLSDWGRRNIEGRSMPSFEFNPQRVYVECEGGEINGRWNIEHRDEEGMLRAEAELFLLINEGGTPQDQETLDRARGLDIDVTDPVG